MIGLQGYRPDLTDYHDCIELIESRMKEDSVAELEDLNAKNRQAGVTCLKYDDFKQMPYYQFVPENAGIRFLELCSIIAGPTMVCSIAEYGAGVVKVTSPYLSDVPFFQIYG
ncbi:hypothetical protein N7G274_004269 [Stereocaulon virgatum]|uniref:Uncharacterized protein n=1 Tax=Stereocaulon virgatum TaxID=373712 RepID=A0ABR4ACJ7_9LECA